MDCCVSCASPCRRRSARRRVIKAKHLSRTKREDDDEESSKCSDNKLKDIITKVFLKFNKYFKFEKKYFICIFVTLPWDLYCSSMWQKTIRSLLVTNLDNGQNRS